MNNKESVIKRIDEFIASDEKGLLLTGTHQYEKHKLVMRILNMQLNNKLLLFRTNAMQNITSHDHLGWAGVKRCPKAGERVKIGKSTYEFDSMNTTSTWHKTSPKFACAIVYPIDSLLRSANFETIDNLFQSKEISKVFLVSWTDHCDYDYSLLSKYVSRCVVYDAEEEDPEYHQRVIELLR